ncbi:MAG: YceI family protein [Microthrixaceae bacterium]
MNKVAGSVRSHPWLSLLGVCAIALAAVGFFARDIISVALAEDEPIDYTLPLVKALEPGAGEVVYRVDANQSLATVRVTEVLAGVDNDGELTTSGLAGDIGVTDNDAATARLSEFAVSVHQLESDNRLRDNILQHEYLDSHDHRTVSLLEAEIVDFEQADGSQVATFAIEGDLEVKGERTPVRFEGSGEVDGNAFTATVTSQMKMSELGVGPITKVGLVSTGDDIEIELDLVAIDSRNFSPPVGLSLDTVASEADTEGAPSFAADIQPILEANCAGCHNTGAVGAQMVTLDTAADAAEVADGLGIVTRTGYMPPWPPSDEGVELQHSRGLDPDEIELIGRWSEAGGPLDVDAETPIEAPEEPEVVVPDADVVMQMPEPYVGDGTKPDDYRCFLMDPGFTEDAMITGTLFTPGAMEVVHHVLSYRVPPNQVDSLQRRDAQDEGPGWTCPTGMGTGGRELIAGWVPGARPRDFGEGVGMPMGAGDMVVTQIHYHYEGILRPDQSMLALEVADDPDSVIGFRATQLVGPVEIPCPPGADGPYCDREAAFAEVNERLGGAGIANALHGACGTTPEGLAAESDGYTANTTCEFRVRTGPSGGHLVDFLGHMHEIGSSYRMTLNKGTPEEQVLLDIPVWNFAWQLNYQPVEPIPVTRADTITVECSWDRSLRFDPEPRYIFFADGTEDEMCFSTVTIIPDAPHQQSADNGQD